MTDAELRTTLQSRLQAVETRIAAACQRVGRARTEVTLVAVTKTVSPRVAGFLPELGCLDLGENRPQELWRKAAALAGLPVRWHMIGHLQRNKIDRTLPLTTLFHSVDRVSLLEALATEGAKQGRRPQVLLQVNISHEEQKQGFDVAELAGVRTSIAALPIDIVGLMGMAAYADDPEQARPAFRELRTAQATLGAMWPASWTILSMGMSGDFEVAIEEGATHVRVGTTLFAGLENE
jgi:pyridoxal phosphate enzyme (YggS family)